MIKEREQKILDEAELAKKIENNKIQEAEKRRINNLKKIFLNNNQFDKTKFYQNFNINKIYNQKNFSKDKKIEFNKFIHYLQKKVMGEGKNN